MAISQVRVNFNGQWCTLAYNSETQRYEGHITPTASSHGQSGGYYGLTVEASNDSGAVSTVDSSISKALRLVVKEVTEPEITLVSPPQGYLTTNAPSIVFTVTDEAGGSGVDLATLSVFLDGNPALYSTEPIANGYRVTCALSGLDDGPHTITAAVSDHDGNQADLSLFYTVDTTPPMIQIMSPNAHRIIDDDAVLISGTALDATAPPVTVHIFRDGEDLGEISLSASGAFLKVVPLAVGVNEITITAADGAGLVSTEIFRIYRMVTDRMQADVDELAELLAKVSLTGAELHRLANTHFRGAYDFTDLNRVTAAMEYLNELLTAEGNQIGYVPIYPEEGRTTWLEDDTFVKHMAAEYLSNVERLRDAIPADVPKTPADMGDMHYEEANDIEKILVGIDAVHQYLETSQWYAGEIYCSEV